MAYTPASPEEEESVGSLGVGLYTLQDAARLVRAEPRTLRRWLFGYQYMSGRRGLRERRFSAPLWSTQYVGEELGLVLGFQDLLELRIVREFARAGVPLIVIRNCLDAARDIFRDEFPFTHQRFVTDGATIFHQALKRGEEEGEMLNLRSRQYAFREIIKSSLYTGIEYDGKHARRWFPEQRSRAVVLDPERQFGHPMLHESGVPTSAVYASYLAEGQERQRVARLFEIETREVDAAVRFEIRLHSPA